MKRNLVVILLFCICVFASCNSGQSPQSQSTVNDKTRIVSLNGTATEVLCSLGLENKLVGTDVTSTYPESAAKLPKVGHNRDVSVESLLSLNPTLVIGLDDNIKPELKQQLASAHIRLLLFHLDHSIAGAKKLIVDMADTLGYPDKAAAIAQGIDKDTAGLNKPATAPKVLFIYARGVGTMMVSGKNNAVNSMIELAGGQNAIQEFSDFKPLTSEAVIAANPDVILMFDRGLESLGGINGLLQVPGVSQTNAGKNRKVIEMDGQFLTGFSPRVGKAVAELSKKINEAAKP